jgi:hypothetical protein
MVAMGFGEGFRRPIGRLALPGTEGWKHCALVLELRTSKTFSKKPPEHCPEKKRLLVGVLWYTCRKS